MSQSNLSAEFEEKITEYGSLITDLLAGEDLKYKTRDLKYKTRMDEIVVPNSYEQKIDRVFRLFKELCERQDSATFCVFIDGEFKNIKAGVYLSNRLDYINEKIKNNRVSSELDWLKVIFLIIMIPGIVWGVLMWQSWLSREKDKIKKIIDGVAYLVIGSIYVFIFCFFIYSLSLGSPIVIMLSSLVLALFLIVNSFFSIRFFNKEKCQEFRNKYQEMKDFIQSYRDLPQNIQQDNVKSYTETDILEHDRQKNNQSENSGLTPDLNNDEHNLI